MDASQGPLHTIFGAGQVGTHLADELVARGARVRLVRRSAPGPDKPGVTWMQGDVTDSQFADRACDGAQVVYNCTNPAAYHRWDELLPPLANGIREAATRADARLVVLDNLYMYGHTEADGTMNERTPMRPCSRKGELRKRLAETLFQAHERGEVRVAVGRASDFFGPGGINSAVFRPRTLDQLRAGKPVEVLGDPDTRHSYNYIPDVARGLAVLGTDTAGDGKVWHLPTAFHGTTRELLQRFADHHGNSLKLRRIPTWAIRAVGVFVPLMGALAEMMYQWESDFILDDTAFREQFGLEPTALDEAVRATARWGEGVTATTGQKPLDRAV